MHPGVLKMKQNYNKNARPVCPICRGSHGLKTCPLFLDLSAEQRMIVARSHQCCLMCLAMSHPTSRCTSKRPCIYCGDMHSALLHQESSRNFEMPQYNNNNNNNNSNSNINQQKVYTCRLCGEKHGLKACKAFLRMSVDQRMNLVRSHQHCWMCLAASHSTSECKSKILCKKCDQMHNTLLHNTHKNVTIDNSVTEFDRPKQQTGYICKICGNQHGLKACKRFLNMSVPERMAEVRKNKHCWTCLAVSHPTNRCPSKFTCKRCGGNHNTLLHQDHPPVDQSFNNFNNSNMDSLTYTCPVCGDRHGLKICPGFLLMSSNERMNVVRQNNCCWICLSVSHTTRACKSKLTCKHCQQMHNALLHPDPNPAPNYDIFEGPQYSQPSQMSETFQSVQMRRDKLNCCICGGTHRVVSCRNFLAMSAKKKIEAVRKHRLCRICLVLSHSTDECISQYMCGKCDQNHHTLLHRDPSPKQNVNTNRPIRRNAPAALLNTTQVIPNFQQNPLISSLLQAAAAAPIPSASHSKAVNKIAPRRNNPRTRRTASSIQRRRPNAPQANNNNIANMNGAALNPEVIAQTCRLLSDVQEVLRQMERNN